MGLIKNYGNDQVFGASRLLGTQDGAAATTVNFTVDALDLYLNGVRVSSAPATSGATGTAGEYAVDSSYAYFCVAANTWKRVAIASW